MIVKILTPVIVMAALGTLFGVGLAMALKAFGVKVEENILKVLSLLPGTNCGACGRPGCSALAEALTKGEAEPAACVVSSEEARKAIAHILGLDHTEKVKTVATMLCNGGKRAKDKYTYEGIMSCKAASLVFSGYKACSFGCLGLADCVNICPFDALTIGPDGLPIVDEHKCTACGKCVTACPKGLYVLLPAAGEYYVKCSSKDPGGMTMKVCSSGCIGCMKCVKPCPNAAVAVSSNLSRIDPAKCRNAGQCFEACPTKVIVKRRQ